MCLYVELVSGSKDYARSQIKIRSVIETCAESVPETEGTDATSGYSHF